MTFTRTFTRRTFITALTAFSATLSGRQKSFAASDDHRFPIGRIPVLGHRGAPALRPEHSLASYSLAVTSGADFIEPDLVPTKDGVLVSHHEGELSETTDIANKAEFATRRTTITRGGRQQTGWFVHDFTLAELKTLRLKERMPSIRTNSASYDGIFQMLTFDEIIAFVSTQAIKLNRIIGLVPELKFSTYYNQLGFNLEDMFLESLSRQSYFATAPIIVQSFEIANLKALHQNLRGRSNIKLMQLTGNPEDRPLDVVSAGGHVTFGDMTSPEGLKHVAGYADILCPDIRRLIPVGDDGRLAPALPIIRDAHDVGLKVYGYEFRPENCFLAPQFRNTNGDIARNEDGSMAEIRAYMEAGIDGFFTDDPGIGRKAVDGLG